MYIIVINLDSLKQVIFLQNIVCLIHRVQVTWPGVPQKNSLCIFMH